MNFSKQDLALILIALQDVELDTERKQSLRERALRLQAVILHGYDDADEEMTEPALAHQVDALRGDV